MVIIQLGYFLKKTNVQSYYRRILMQELKKKTMKN